MVPFRPITANGIPLFSAPKLGVQCVSPIKNLDDPKLLSYFNDLQIVDPSNPHRELTRAEFVKMIINAARLAPKDANLDILANFTDVNRSEWFAPYVAYALEYGIISGQKVDLLSAENIIVREFRPNDTISRAEASKVLSALILKDVSELPVEEDINTFSDIAKNFTLAPFVEFAYDSCLLHGRNTIDGQPIDGTPRVFEPIDGITLAETAKVLYNMTHPMQEKISNN